MSSHLNSNFYDISFKTQNAAFVVAVAGGSGAAEDGITVFLQLPGEGVDFFLAANAERNVGIAKAVQQIAADVKRRTGGGTVGLTFPITSRNRFSVPLRGIAMGCKKVVVMLSYPSDEMGNAFLTLEQVEAAGVNPWTDTLLSLIHI